MRVLWLSYLVLFVFGMPLYAQYYNSVQHIVGERAAGMGGAYSALGDNSTALWYNPAGLAGIKNPSLNISLNSYSYLTTEIKGYMEMMNWMGDTHEIDLKESDFSIVGTSLIYGKRLGKNTGLAFGLFAPFQENIVASISDSVTSPIYVDPDNGSQSQYDYMLKKSITKSSKYYLGMAGIGHDIGFMHIGFSIGFGNYSEVITGGDFVYREHVITKAKVVKFSYAENSKSIYTAMAKVGGRFFIGDNQVIGLQVKTPDVSISGSKQQNLSEEESSVVVEEDLEAFTFLFPSQLALGYGYMLPGMLGIDIDLLWSSTSSFHAVSALNFRGGIEYFLNKKITLRAGGFTDFSQSEIIRENGFNESSIDYYGGTFSLSFAKDFSIVKDNVTQEKHLWSTFGLSYRMGRGDVEIYKLDKMSTEVPPVKSQTVHHVSVFIAESLAF
ncbi:MAG: hypothetical protein HQK83_18140 [Fibrobacteria bacterium]|nr:hypothetical protein [Fibrobacteria bacterium]